MKSLKYNFAVKKPTNEKYLASLWKLYNRNFRSSKWSKEHLLSFTKSPSVLYALESDRKVAGFVCGKPERQRRNRYLIAALLVRKEFRGKGCAGMLIKKVVKEVSEMKEFKSIAIHFRESNNLKDFYRKFGFKKHRITGSYSNGEKKHYMEITL